MESGCGSPYRKFVIKCCGCELGFHTVFHIVGYGQYSHHGIESVKFHEEGKYTNSEMPEVRCREKVRSWILESCGGLRFNARTNQKQISEM